MARQGVRSRRAKQRRRERDIQRRQAILESMNAFLESDIQGAFEDLQPTDENPFDDRPTLNFNTRDEAVRHMQATFKTSDERRMHTFATRTGTKVDADHYLPVVNTLGSDVFKKLQERYQLDSEQFIDMVVLLPSNISDRDLEIALIQLEQAESENSIDYLNMDAILEAMELGFTLNEAIELTEMDNTRAINTYNAIEILGDIARIAMDESVDTETSQMEIQARYEDMVRDRINQRR